MALIAEPGGAFARAIGRHLVEPRDDRAVAAMLIDQPARSLTAMLFHHHEAEMANRRCSRGL